MHDADGIDSLATGHLTFEETTGMDSWRQTGKGRCNAGIGAVDTVIGISVSEDTAACAHKHDAG